MAYRPWILYDREWYDDDDTRRPDEHDRRFRGIDYDEEGERYARPGYREGFFAHSLYPTEFDDLGPDHHETYRSYEGETRGHRRDRQRERTVERLRTWMHEGPHTGRGPQGYARSDASIHEEACDRLTHHGWVDATDITVNVEQGEVTLEGTAESRREKRMAEDALEDISGVKDIHNHLRIRRASASE